MMIMDDVKLAQRVGFRVRVKFENLQDQNTFYVYINPTVIRTVTDFINKIREFFGVEEELTLTCNNCVLTSKDDINVLRDEDLVIVCGYFPPTTGSALSDNDFFRAQSFSSPKNFCEPNASGRRISASSDQRNCSTSRLRNIGSPSNGNSSRSVYNIANNANSARVENSSLPVGNNNVSRTGSRSDVQPLVVLAELASEHDAPGLNAAAAAAIAVSTRVPALGRSPQSPAILYDAASRTKNSCNVNNTYDVVPNNIPIAAAETATSWNYNVRVIDCPSAAHFRNSKATVGTGGTIISTLAASSHALSISQNVALSNQFAQNDTVTLPSASLVNGVPRISADVEFLSENYLPRTSETDLTTSRCNGRKGGKDQPINTESEHSLSAISNGSACITNTNRDRQQAMPVSLSDDDSGASVVTVEDDSSVTEASNRDHISGNGFSTSDMRRPESHDDGGSSKRKHADVDEQRHDDENKRRKMFSVTSEDDVGKTDDSDEFCECVTANPSGSVCPTTFQKNSLQTSNTNIAELNGKNLVAVTPSSTKLFESAALVVNDSLGVRKKRTRKRKRKNKGNNEQFATNVPTVQQSPVLITPGFSGVHIRFDSDSDSPSDYDKDADDAENCPQESTLVRSNESQPSNLISETISNSSAATCDRPSGDTSAPRSSTSTPPLQSEWSDKSKQDNGLLEREMFETTMQNLMAFKDFPITPSYSLKFQVSNRSIAPASVERKCEHESTTSTSSSQNNSKPTTSVRLSPTPVDANQRQRENIAESQNDAKTSTDRECERSDGSCDTSRLQNDVKLTFTEQNTTLTDAPPKREHESRDTSKVRGNPKMTVFFTGSKAEVIDNGGSVILSMDIDKAADLLPLHTNPEVGDVITFYILKLDSNITPTVSGVICGEIVSVDGDNLKLKTLYGKKELNKPASTSHILFECGGDDATSDFNEMKVDRYGIVELRWANMLNARLVTRL